MKERANVVRKDLIQSGIGRGFALLNAKNNIGERYSMPNLS